MTRGLEGEQGGVARAESTEKGTRGRSGGGWVIASLLLLAVVFGALAFWRFTKSDRFIQRTLAEVEKRGVGLAPEGCVDEVMAWSRRCEAMKALCDGSVPRFIEACLRGGDRSAYCAGLGDRYLATSFGVPECRGRVRAGDHDAARVCALTYSAIARHCERLRLRTRAVGKAGEGAR